MPPRRRKTAQKSTAPVVRIHRIGTIAQLENLLEKAGNRVVVVQFFQASLPICANMRSYFQLYSSMPQFRSKVVFAEVELDQAEEVGHHAGVTRLPTYRCYWQRELKSTYTGGVPTKVQQLIQEAQAEFCSGGGGLLRKLLTALAVVGVAVGGVYAFTQLGGGGEGQAGDEEALADVSRKLAVAYERLRACEAGGRTKGVIAQRKLISRLEARMRSLQKNQDGKQQKARAPAASAAAPSRSARKAVAAEGSGGYYSDEDERGQAAEESGEEGRVVYSDEEE